MDWNQFTKTITDFLGHDLARYGFWGFTIYTVSDFLKVIVPTIISAWLIYWVIKNFTHFLRPIIDALRLRLISSSAMVDTAADAVFLKEILSSTGWTKNESGMYTNVLSNKVVTVQKSQIGFSSDKIYGYLVLVDNEAVLEGRKARQVYEIIDRRVKDGIKSSVKRG